MLLLPVVLALALLQSPTPDSTARQIVVGPAESLQVTIMGPASGPPVVFIPGLISPAYAYRHVLPPLAAAGVHVILIEPLGVGHSSRPGNADYSHTMQAARVAAVMDSLGLKHVVLTGNAVGTAIALRLTIARPELVGRLLLVEGGALETAAVPGVKSALKFAFLVRIFAGRGRLRKELKKGLISSSGDTTWVTDSVINGYTTGSAGDIGAVLRALKGMQRATEPDSLTPRLGKIMVPVRLLVGGAAHDAGVSPGRIRALRQRLHHFTEVTVPGAGLNIHEEQPDLIVRELLTQVRENGT